MSGTNPTPGRRGTCVWCRVTIERDELTGDWFDPAVLDVDNDGRRCGDGDLHEPVPPMPNDPSKGK